MNTLEKFFYVSIGLVADVTKKLEDSVTQLVKEGKLSEIDAKKIVDEFKQSTVKYKDEVTKKLNELIEHTIENIKLVKQDELEEVKKRIEQLEEKIKKL